MIQLYNYSIHRIDAYNITYAVYKKIDTSKGRQPKDASQKRDAYKWVESQKYYGTLQACLNGIKNEILMQLVNDAPSDANEVLKDIERIEQAINNLDVKINFEGVRESINN